jgi:hypothetical protein
MVYGMLISRQSYRRTLGAGEELREPVGLARNIDARTENEKGGNPTSCPQLAIS